LAIGLAGAMILVAGCRDAAKNRSAGRSGGGGLISLSGTVGAVKLGVSTEVDVTAALGSPEATASDDFQIGAGEYKALGYGCSMTNTRHRRVLTYFATTGPYCQTVYYLNLEKGVVGSFWTTSRAFHTKRGTHVGTATEMAERHERHPARYGCHSGLTETSAKVVLVLDIEGDRARPLHPGRNDHLARPTGGHVSAFAEDSQTSGVGLLFC